MNNNQVPDFFSFQDVNERYRCILDAIREVKDTSMNDAGKNDVLAHLFKALTKIGNPPTREKMNAEILRMEELYEKMRVIAAGIQFKDNTTEKHDEVRDIERESQFSETTSPANPA